MGTPFFLLFDLGIPEEHPGFPENYSPSELPVGGLYTGLEMALANAFADSSSRCAIISPPSKVKWFEDTVKEWNINITIVPYQGHLRDISSMIASLDADVFILQNLCSIFSVGGGSISRIVHNFSGNELFKCSVGSMPVELYICGKSLLQKIVDGAEQDRQKDDLISLFKTLLLDFTDLVEIPGIIFYQKSLYEYFQHHLQFISDDLFLHPALKSLFQRKPQDSQIGKNGHVGNSLISPGVKIDGTVENSFIFSNVIIKEGASVKNSIVLPGHTIGKKAVIENTLLLPCENEPAPGTTVGEKSRIGGKSKIVNNTYPEQIHSGLTVIGFNVEIPSDTVIEPSVCIDCGVSKGDIKRRKIIKKGSYLSPEE